MLSLTVRRGQTSQVTALGTRLVCHEQCRELLSLDVIGIWNCAQRFFRPFVI